MNLLTAIIKAKRPSRIKDMPALVNTFLCRKGFSGITLFGRIFTNDDTLETGAEHGEQLAVFLRPLWLLLAEGRVSQPQAQESRLLSQPL